MRYVLLKGECQGTLLACHEYTWLILYEYWPSFYVEGIIAGNDCDMYKGILCLSCTKESYACHGGR